VENSTLALAGGCFFILYKFVRRGRANAALFYSGTRGRELGHVFKSAVMVGPRCRLLTHPPDGLDDFNVRDFDGAMKNRLMMGNPISESAECIEASMNVFTRLPAACQKSLVETLAPNRGVVLRSEQANPKREFEFGNHFARG
jgi:hypothetical protein